MTKYKVDVLRPGVTTGVSGIDRKYEEDVLQESVDSLKGVPVTRGSSQTNADETIGEVVSVGYGDGAVSCTIEISDDEMAARIDEDPEPVESMEFRNLFLAPQVSELVGSTEREE